MKSFTYYELLEVEAGAGPEEIKESYRLLISLLHPDRYPAESAQQKRAQEKVRQINEAYDVLKNPVSRAAYDSDLAVKERVERERLEREVRERDAKQTASSQPQGAVRRDVGRVGSYRRTSERALKETPPQPLPAPKSERRLSREAKKGLVLTLLAIAIIVLVLGYLLVIFLVVH